MLEALGAERQGGIQPSTSTAATQCNGTKASADTRRDLDEDQSEDYLVTALLKLFKMHFYIGYVTHSISQHMVLV